MPCLLVLLAVLVPRVALAMIFLFTQWLEQAYANWLWPLLGFIFMPYTTIAYMAAALSTAGPFPLGWILVIVLAVLADISHWGGGYRARRRRVIVVEE